MSTVGRILGTAGIVTGVVGAAAFGGVTAQRMAVRKYQAAQAALLTEPGADPGFEALPSDRTYSVDSWDGVALHVEEIGPLDAPLTVIFAHGWTLRLGSWHYQRLGLAGPGFGAPPPADAARPARRRAAPPAARLVFYDHRSHGKSTRAPEGHSTMDYLASDLRSVIDTAAPTGPVVLIGHSMGGMAIFTLAAQDPDLFAERIAGVGLVCTGATYLKPSELSKLLIVGGNPLVRVIKEVGSRYPAIFERGRSSNRDAVWMLTRSLGFSRKDVSGALVDYLDEMVSATPVEVIAEFLPTLFAHDQTAAVPALAGIPTMIVAGDQDRMTPLDRSERIAEVLPEAEIVVAQGSGHMTMMEDPELTNDALRRLLQRAADGVNAPRGRSARWSRAGR
ncbi:alpha/beta fold hydrolase [Nakamurella sp.]|uniref:alpha/beta fold hydrolase n=1 Tax=Nakamurella sp. TaxID=1869182 RepID=UPI003B3B7A30